MALFHITTRVAWEAAQATGEYRAPSLESEGFIHLSGEQQWLRTANRFFKGQRGLVLLALREESLSAPVKYEPADGEHFPHLYGALNLDAVAEVHELHVGPDGEIGRRRISTRGSQGVRLRGLTAERQPRAAPSSGGAARATGRGSGARSARRSR